MKPLLVIAYFFPPLGGGGVQRTLGFVRHLPAFGYNPVVLAAAPSVAYWAMDESLLHDLPPGVEVHRVADGLWSKSVGVVRRACPRAYRERLDAWCLVPDRQAPWMAPALRVAFGLLASRRFSAVYSTGLPWTDHLVAEALHLRRRLPWVADFRDPWTQNQTYRPASPLHDRLHRALEASVYARADRVVANTRANELALHRDFPATRGKTLHLPNGFDADRIAGLRARAKAPRHDRVLITYAGSLYSGYGAEAFLGAIARVLALAPELRAKLRVRFIGKTAVCEVARRLGIDDVVEEPGYVPRDEVDRRLLEGHASLLLLPPHEGRSGWVPQKLYAYLGIGRPILALLPEGEAAEILREAGGEHLILDPSDPDSEALLRWLRRLADPGFEPVPFRVEVVKRYDRQALTRRLAATFDELTGSEGGAAVRLE